MLSQTPEVVMARFMVDCGRFPSEGDCTLVIIGDEDEVLRTASEHAVSVHGHADSPELREQIRATLEPAPRETPVMYWY